MLQAKCARMLEKRRFWKERWKTGRETKHRLGKNATELFYLSVGRQPAWLRLRSLASYRSTHAGRKEEEARRGSEVQARPGPSPFGSPPPCNGSGNGGRMHPSVVHRCNSNNGTRDARFLRDNPFFPRPFFLSLAHQTTLVRPLFFHGTILFLFLWTVCRASVRPH